MKLHLSIPEAAAAMSAQPNRIDSSGTIDQIAFDTRKLGNTKNTLFFAFSGAFRDGHDYLDQAYQQGIRYFCVDQHASVPTWPDALFFVVDNTLRALQDLAQYHRQKFSYPVIAITGSVGKTTVKEWLFHLLSNTLHVVRSPKSYNSQLGVALSLLELKPEHDLAIIEAGISQPGEMERLAEMIAPTWGVLTSIGSAHAANFSSKNDIFNEKMRLFHNCDRIFVAPSLPSTYPFSTTNLTLADDHDPLLPQLPFQDYASRSNAALAIIVARSLGIEQSELERQTRSLPRLAMRMETMEGTRGNLIVNDAYNFDLDALTQSLEYQKQISAGRKRIAILATDNSVQRTPEIEQLVQAFQLDQVIWVEGKTLPDVSTLSNSVILLKGTRASELQRLTQLFQLKKHKTRVEIDLSAALFNLHFFKRKIKPETQLLVMVKASSYGSGAEQMARFLEQAGVNYLGVAYPDEGVELRQHGITLPILVMNPEEAGFDDIVDHQLEPAIYSFEQLDEFIKTLITRGIDRYPVHLKLDTGMRRLGFSPHEIPKLIAVIAAQPEIRVKGIYSHLADADNFEDDSYTHQQANLFQQLVQRIESELNVTTIKHLLNTEAIVRFPEYQFDMVRMGIGLYGSSSNPAIRGEIRPAIQWKSIVSQVRAVQPNESVGYNRRFLAHEPHEIATIPVGYADGYKRSLGRGKGGVVINGRFCPTVGNVCMDMIMVDVTGLSVRTGDEVEIIGEVQTLENLAAAMETIPYEVLTSISKRVQRLYVGD